MTPVSPPPSTTIARDRGVAEVGAVVGVLRGVVAGRGVAGVGRGVAAAPTVGVAALGLRVAAVEDDVLGVAADECVAVGALEVAAVGVAAVTAGRRGRAARGGVAALVEVAPRCPG